MVVSFVYRLLVTLVSWLWLRYEVTVLRRTNPKPHQSWPGPGRARCTGPDPAKAAA